MGSDAIRSGDVVGGRYRVGSILSRSRGLLFEGVHTDFEQRVVIRVLPASLCDPKEVKRFQREARLLTRLESEHVARLLDVGTLPSGALFYVRPYLEGIDLGTYLTSRGALPLDEATLLILQAAEAVAESHVHNVILRELSPSHIFLTRRVGGEPLVKVIDFGTAKLMREPTATGGGEVTATTMFGLSCYSSPEVARKLRTIDPRADIWSLGAIFYQMLAGRLPFDGSMAVLMLQICREQPTPIGELREDLPAVIEQILGWTLAKEADGRFANVYGFAHALAPFASPEGQLLIQRIGTMTTAAEQRRMTQSSIPPELPLVHGSEPPPEPVKAKGDRDSSPTLIRDMESIVRERRASRASMQDSPAATPAPIAAMPAEPAAPPEPVADVSEPMADMAAAPATTPEPLAGVSEPSAATPEPLADMLAPIADMLDPAADMPAPRAAPSDPLADMPGPPADMPDPTAAGPAFMDPDAPIEQRVLIDLSLVATLPTASEDDVGRGFAASGAPASERRAAMGVSPGSWSPEMADASQAVATVASQSASNWGSPSPFAPHSPPHEAGLHPLDSAPPGSGQWPAGSALSAGASGHEGMPPLASSKTPPVRPQTKEVRVARIAFASALIVLLGALGYAFFRGYGKGDAAAVAAATATSASASALNAQPPDPSAGAVDPASPSGQPLDPDAIHPESSAQSALPEGAPPGTAAPLDTSSVGPAPTAVSTAHPSPPATAPSRATTQPTASSAPSGNSAGSAPTSEPSSEPAPSKLVEAPPTATAATSPPQAVDSAEMGTLIAVAMGGSCAFSINDAGRGTTTMLKIPIKAGTYVVSCAPANGAAQSKSVTISPGGVGMATFKVQ
jgi:eukaryotic-like serine/threonine-protein kinase